MFDPEKKAVKIAEVVAAGISPQQFEADIDAAQASAEQPDNEEDDGGGDWLISLFKPAYADGGSVTPPAPRTDFIKEGTTLFGGADLAPDYAFAKTALRQLSTPDPIADFSQDDSNQTITLTAPRDLQ